MKFVCNATKIGTIEYTLCCTTMNILKTFIFQISYTKLVRNVVTIATVIYTLYIAITGALSITGTFTLYAKKLFKRQSELSRY